MIDTFVAVRRGQQPITVLSIPNFANPAGPARAWVVYGEGQRITSGQYVRVGIVLTLTVLLATLLALWAWLPVVSSVR